MISRLLINEPPLLVLPSLAARIGLNEALVLQQMHYWQTNKNNKNVFDGRVWVRNTYEEWIEEFPFWGKNTIVRTIDNLSEQLLILTCKRREGFRNLKYYTIDYDALNQLAGLMVTTSCILTNENDEKPDVDLPILGRQIAEEDGSTNGSYAHDAAMTSLVDNAFSQVGGLAHNGHILQDKRIHLPKMGRSTYPNVEHPESFMETADVDSLCNQQPTHSSVSRSPTTQNGQTHRPNLGRRSTQNGYTDLPKMGRTYIDSETSFRDKNYIPPLTPPNVKSSKEEDEEKILFQMIHFWNYQVQPNILNATTDKVGLSDKRRVKLMAFYRGLMNSDLQEWRRYCEQISQIRFLLGHGPNGFKVSLDWAVDPDNALKVLEGKIYDKPEDAIILKDKSPDELNQDIDELFRAYNYPVEWLEIYRAFARVKGQATFAAWLKPCVPCAAVDGRAFLIAPTKFHRDHMSANYLFDLKNIAIGCWKNETEIIIEVKK